MSISDLKIVSTLVWSAMQETLTWKSSLWLSKVQCKKHLRSVSCRLPLLPHIFWCQGRPKRDYKSWHNMLYISKILLRVCLSPVNKKQRWLNGKRNICWVLNAYLIEHECPKFSKLSNNLGRIQQICSSNF
jgi:hypothetical protein